MSLDKYYNGILILGQGSEFELGLGVRQPLPDYLDGVVEVLGLGGEAERKSELSHLRRDKMAAILQTTFSN